MSDEQLIVTFDWPRERHGSDRTLAPFMISIWNAVTGEQLTDVVKVDVHADAMTQDLYADLHRLTDDPTLLRVDRALIAPCVLTGRVVTNAGE